MIFKVLTTIVFISELIIGYTLFTKLLALDKFIMQTNDTVIKDLSANLQKEIKERIKRTTDLDVKEVNIKVKNTIDAKPENDVSA